jgi:SAM-dependent methyltransferase
VHYGKKHFHAPNVRFAQADCLALPFSPGCFDLVVAFEIIEHLDDPQAFLAELRRVLDPGGTLILSTPNRLYYTDDRGEINPFHRKEFSYPEFDEVLRLHFPHRSILFQNHVAGLAISGPGAELNAPALSADCFFQENSAAPAVADSRRGAHFFVALCSAQPIGPIEPLLYLPSAANILREREIYIHLLEQRLSEKDAYVLALQADYDRKIEWARSLESDLAKARVALESLQADYDRDLAKARTDLQSLQEDYDRNIEWARSLERDLNKAREDFGQLGKEFEERTAWALRLDRDLRFLMDSRWYRLGRNLNLSPVPPSRRGPSDSGSG